MDPADIEDLFEELEDMSDSAPEVDTMSISSTPKPSLRPFFASSRSLLHDSLNVPGNTSTLTAYTFCLCICAYKYCVHWLISHFWHVNGSV